MLLPGLAMLGMLGLPYNPAAVGWAGITGPSVRFSSFIFLLAVVFLVWGYFRHAFQPRDELHRMERWIHTVYPTGLLLLIAGHWVIGIFGWQGSLSLGVWWASAAATLIAGIGIFLAFFLPRKIGLEAINIEWVRVFGRQAGGMLGDFLRLNWLFRFFAWSYGLLQNIVQLMAAVFEGDGGVLWSLVMLALLISLISTGGTP